MEMAEHLLHHSTDRATWPEATEEQATKQAEAGNGKGRTKINLLETRPERQSQRSPKTATSGRGAKDHRRREGCRARADPPSAWYATGDHGRQKSPAGGASNGGDRAAPAKGAILDRGWGKPKQTIEAEATNGTVSFLALVQASFSPEVEARGRARMVLEGHAIPDPTS